MKKITKITDEVLEQKAKEEQWFPPYDLDGEGMVEVLGDKFGFEVRTNFDDSKYCDLCFYVERTADDYEVFIVNDNTHKDFSYLNKVPYISEGVYYYENNWLDDLHDAVTDGLVVYMDDDYMDLFYDRIEDIYQHEYDTHLTEIENELYMQGLDW